MKLKKKAIMYEFLVRLIIAIVFIVAVVFMGRAFFRLSDQATDSFIFLGDTMEEMTKGLTGVPLIMDDATAIIGFSKDADTFSYTFGKFSFEAKKPGTCGQKSCICLCRNDLEVITTKGTNILECGDYFCKVLEKSDFPADYQPNYFTDRDLSADHYQRGFFLMRGGGAGFLDLAVTGSDVPDLIANQKAEERRRTIYIEKDDGIVKIYEKTS